MDGNTRICKKCLLREMDEAGFFQNMYDYNCKNSGGR